MMHTFAPATCQACTCSVSSPRHYDAEDGAQIRAQAQTHIIVDDEFVLVDVEELEAEDGGPLCREGEIEGWKATVGCKKVMLRERKRRLSMRCFGGE